MRHGYKVQCLLNAVTLRSFAFYSQSVFTFFAQNITANSGNIFTWAIPVCCFNYSDKKHSLTHHCFHLFAYYTVCSSSANVRHVSAWPSHHPIHV
jgi:hypothetical protein